MRSVPGRVERLGDPRAAIDDVAHSMAPLVVALREFEMEWPRGSGRMRRFPEIDHAEWMPLDRPRTKLVRGQVPVIDALARDVLNQADGP